MPRINSNSKIVDSGTGFEDSFDKIVGSEPALIFNNPHAFGTANRMFYPYPERGNLPVAFLLTLTHSRRIFFN
jgi:hypothetical protein